MKIVTCNSNINLAEAITNKKREQHKEDKNNMRTDSGERMGKK